MAKNKYGIRVGDLMGFEKEHQYLGMGAEPPYGRKYKFIPITKITSRGLTFTETRFPYAPNTFFIPWKEIDKYHAEGRYKFRKRRGHAKMPPKSISGRILGG